MLMRRERVVFMLHEDEVVKIDPLISEALDDIVKLLN